MFCLCLFCDKLFVTCGLNAKLLWCVLSHHRHTYSRNLCGQRVRQHDHCCCVRSAPKSSWSVTYMACWNAGRGRQVIAVCKSADLLLMVLDASKPDFHRDILTRELESVGIRLNRNPPNIYFKKKKTGGISFNSVVPLTHLDEKMCQRILQVGRGSSILGILQSCCQAQWLQADSSLLRGGLLCRNTNAIMLTFCSKKTAQ